MNNKKVVVRILDIGGDKILKYFNFVKELSELNNQKNSKQIGRASCRERV